MKFQTDFYPIVMVYFTTCHVISSSSCMRDRWGQKKLRLQAHSLSFVSKISLLTPILLAFLFFHQDGSYINDTQLANHTLWIQMK